MIVIPMAGLSSRFFKAGYTSPKYMLEVHGKTLFHYTVSSFETLFETERFVFIVRDSLNSVEFIKSEISKLGIKQYHVCVLSHETRGQAETVYEGIKEINKTIIFDPYESLTIFNIDTIRRNFYYPDKSLVEDGYLEVFDGEGNNWSFVKPENSLSTLVVKTTEKDPISSLCCTGLYYFTNIKDYLFAFENYLKLPEDEWEKGELYVAPLYNILIRENKKIHYHKIDKADVVFAGIPEEYVALKKVNNIFESK